MHTIKKVLGRPLFKFAFVIVAGIGFFYLGIKIADIIFPLLGFERLG